MLGSLCKGSLVSALRIQVPPEAAADLRRYLLRNNVLRMRQLAWVGLICAGVLLALAVWCPWCISPDGSDRWHAKFLVMRGALFGQCALCLLLSRGMVNTRSDDGRLWAFEFGFRGGFGFMAGLWAGVFTPLMQAASMYLLGVLIMAAFLVSTFGRAAFTFGIALITMFATLHWFNPDAGSTGTAVMVNGTVVTLLALLVARFEYVREVGAFLNRRTIAAQNRELERHAMVDGLTQVANRRRFDQALAAHWARCSRHGDSLAVIMADIDFFKAFNDTQGHLAGDDCLREVALALAESVWRADDLVARYGGEEFAVILPGTDLAGAMEVAEKMRLAVADLGVPHRASACGRLTISLGVAAQSPRDGGSPADLLARADEALYQAKAGGRNRTAAS